jgi:hypothetical protein
LRGKERRLERNAGLFSPLSSLDISLSIIYNDSEEKTMIDILYRISIWALTALLLVLIVLISVVGVAESTLRVLGIITSFFILSSVVLYVLKRKNS